MPKTRRWFILVGGINGAGKSTFIQNRESLRIVSADVGPEWALINPDLITQAIRGNEPRLSLRKANRKAADECARQVRKILSNRSQSLAIETVLSTNKYKKIVRLALKNRYRVQFIYVVLGSVDEAIRRVRLRVTRDKGHNVPQNKIRSRWAKSLANVPWFWRNSSQAWVFFNGERVEEPILIASRSGKTAFNPEALALLLPNKRY